MSQKLLNEPLQEKNQLFHPFPHSTGFGVECSHNFDLMQSKNLKQQHSIHHSSPHMEHLLQLQHEQQQQLELQRRQQQQLELQRRQQQQLELQRQQQRQLELHRQQQHLELQLQQKLQLELQRQQQQQQLELQRQQQHLELQQQQQLRHHQIKLLQQLEQQHLQQLHSQAQELLLDQLLRHQISDPGYGQHMPDASRDNILDQVQLQRHLLNELQQSSHSSGHLDSSLEQIIQTKINRSTAQGEQADFLDFMSHGKFGNMLPAEHLLRLQQEQFRSRALIQHQLEMERSRQHAGPWSVDEVGPFVRNPSIHPQSQSVGLNDSDLHHKRFSSLEEQFSHLKRNQALQEQQHRGDFDPSATAPGSPTLSAPAPGMKVDNVNSLDPFERHYNKYSNSKVGSFSSGNYSLGQQISADVYTSHPDLIESYQSRQNEQLDNSWAEKQMQQLGLEEDLQRRESKVDSSTWTSAGGTRENSNKTLMDLHQKLGIQSMQSSEVHDQYSTSSSSGRETFWPVPEPQTSDLPFNHFTDQELHMNGSSSEGPLNSCSFAEEQSCMLGSGDPFSSSYAGARLTAKSAVDNELLEGKEKRNGLKGMISRSGSVTGSEDNVFEPVETTLDCGDLQSRTHIRHGSHNSGGNDSLYSNEIGFDKLVGEEPYNDRLRSVMLKVRDKVSEVSSSQDVFPDQNTVPFVKQKNSTSFSTQAKRSVEAEATAKKDAVMRRTSSFNDAAVSEASSFIEILKKPVHFHETEAAAAYTSAFEPTSDGASQPLRSGKKKEKGRQIDPALLGFKVTSNRILMGEIQRLDD